MTSQISEQSLEWTYQRRWKKINAAHGTAYVVGSELLGLVVVIPIMILLSMVIPRPPDIVIIIGLIVFAVLFLLAISFALLFGGMPSRKLRVNRQTITMSDTTVWGTKEHRMTTAGAKFCGIYFDFFERVFTFDTFRADSAYHIEITRNGETFLFPCDDEAQQREMLKIIKENGYGG